MDDDRGLSLFLDYDLRHSFPLFRAHERPGAIGPAGVKALDILGEIADKLPLRAFVKFPVFIETSDNGGDYSENIRRHENLRKEISSHNIKI